jgi:hypothetical protein
MKKCNQCLTEKSLEDFSKSKITKDGFQYKCKSCESQNNKIARQKNPTSKYYNENPNYYKEYSKKWILENQERWKEYSNNWQKLNNKTKYNTDPLYKLKMCIGSRIRLALKNNNKIKEQQTIEYLGCDYKFLKTYLENQFQPNMTWENYGEWEIDHIIPVSKNGSFHYSNLQPLWKIDNRKKSNKL